MKIKKYDTGGMAIYAPFISSRGIPQQLSAGVMSESKSSEKTAEPNYWDKEFLKIAEENALPSDFAAGYQELIEIAQRAQSLSGTSLFGGPEPSMTMSDVLQAKFIANKWKAGRDAYDKASQNITSEKAWNEVATTSTGNIYVYKDNGITTVTPEEFAKNIDDYAGSYLTNSELLAHRHNDIAYHDKWSIDVGGTIGLQTIHKQLLDTIKEFSTTSISEYVKRTGNNVSQSAWKGMQILLGEGPDGYYKVTTKTEMEDVNAAVKYLWNAIGEDGRAKLKAEVAIQGKNPNKADDRYELILSMLQMHTDYTQDSSFEKGATEYDPDGDGKGNVSSSALGEIPYLVRVGRGDGEKELINISMRTDNVMQSGAMLAWAANMGNLIDKNGNSLGMDSLPNILMKAEAIKATRSKDITFGGQLLNDIEKNFIVYDGTSQVTDVWLPFKNIGGKITPDFDKLQKFNEWNDWVHKNPGVTKVEKMNEAYKKGLDPEEMIYDETTGMFQFKPQKMKLFLSFSAYADNDNVDFTKLTEDLTEEMPTEFGRKYKDVFNNLFEYGKTHRQKSDKKVGLSYDKVRSWDLRKGNVFIPIDSDFLAMHMSMTEYAPKSEMNQFAARSTATRQMNYNQDPTISMLGQFM